jgi:hypothetical protein
MPGITKKLAKPNQTAPLISFLCMKHFFITVYLFLSCLCLHAQKTQFSPLNIDLESDVSSELVSQVLVREFGLKATFSLQKEMEKRSPAARYITYNQMYKGKEIQYAGIKACIDRQGKLRWAMNFLKNDLQLPTNEPQWTLSEQAIRMRLLKQFGTFDVQLKRMFWVNKENELKPIWRCWTFSHGQAESYEVLIHAETGEELQRTDRAVYHGKRNRRQCVHQTATPRAAVISASLTLEGDTSGRARLWSPNPVTASGEPYGTLFTDNNDMANFAFEPYIDTVVLRDISYENGQFKLEGPYVRIVDIASRDVAPVTSTNGDFFFTRDQDGWEDVMVYYHVDNFQRYIQSLGFTNLWGDKPLNADPHGRGNSDNSSFISNGDDSNIGFGEGGVDDAEDADVIIHEYGHALAYAGSPGTNTGYERRGLDEGFGDYFASIYSFDYNNGGFGWEQVFSWDGHNPFWPGRFSNNNNSYDPNENFYVIGTVWASVMMEVRQQMVDTTDLLHFELLYSLAPDMTMPDAARIVIAADWMYHNGRNEQLLRNAFCNRGIFSGQECLVTSNETSLEGLRWTATTQNDILYLQWQRPPNASWEAQLFDNQGKMLRGLGRQTSIADLAQGVYLVKMMVEGKVVSTKKVVL